MADDHQGDHLDDDPAEAWAWLPYRTGYAAGHDLVERETFAGGAVTPGRRPMPTFDELARRLGWEGRGPRALELMRQGYTDAVERRRPRY
ncbi:hypothetical protein [Tautonia plasticadhaerens]|uniref:Uncharacterized protein n=1 Tax=Tautonia plasticadhaerens TaxID=2527974 RepID=A0A518H1J2_9BACT|nr:hypothetical protein [Tautonia plasticadhaerens]QDV34708.1 hypothetical protein ElP_26020 [Tautonia plasticadhaerens]